MPTTGTRWCGSRTSSSAPPSRRSGTTSVTFRGHEVDLKTPWRRLGFVDALAEHGLWTRDADELRARLNERGVDTTHDKTWSQLVDHAHTPLRRAAR